MGRDLFYHDPSASIQKLLSVSVQPAADMKSVGKRTSSNTLSLRRMARISEKDDFSAKFHLPVGTAVARTQGHRTATRWMVNNQATHSRVAFCFP